MSSRSSSPTTSTTATWRWTLWSTVGRARRRKPPELTVEVGARATLAAARLDRGAQLVQAADDHVAVGLQAARLAGVEPGERRGVTAGAIARATRGDLVLEPGRAALQARDDVLERKRPIAERQGPATPHALQAVALEDQRETFTPRNRSIRRHDDRGLPAGR